MSPTSRMPALAAWMPSPMPGASSTRVVSAIPAISTSDCPTPTVSTRTTSKPAASSTRNACGVDQARPPRCPREAIERMNTPESVAWSCMRTRSPSSAPPENGDLGSTARTPTRRPCVRNARTRAAVDVDLPTPGLPVSPTTRAPPAYGMSAAITSRNSGDAFSTREIRRPTARASPARARSTSAPTSGLPGTAGTSGRDAQQQCVSLTPAAAQRRGTQAPAAPLQLVGESKCEARTGGADRVSQRNRAAVDIDLLRVDAEHPRRVDGDRREGLVDLDQVQLGD